MRARERASLAACKSVVDAGRGRQDLAMGLEGVAERFGLGTLVAEPVKVAGGLSNEMWRVATVRGTFAVKRMVVNAEHPQFVGNVEGAFRVERHAWAAGIEMPEPVVEPGTDRALVRVGGELFRVHRWVEGRAATNAAAASGAELLASIHAVGALRWEVAPDDHWDGLRWGPELAELSHRVRPAPDRMLVVNSHRDLDRKNALVGEDGQLLALDWDAAGPVGAIHEIVALALDWSLPNEQTGAATDTKPPRDAFVDAIAAYRHRTGVIVPAEPWVFGGWVAALGGWLDYNADHRTEGSCAEVEATKQRMHALTVDLDAWVEALA